MKVAFACWDNRIAPVFDVARTIRVLSIEPDRKPKQTRVELGTPFPDRRAELLSELGIDTLVCGAVSRPLLEKIAALDIRVFSFVSGNLDEVIEAWMQNRLDKDDYRMPGCGAGRGGRRFHGRFRKKSRGCGRPAFISCPTCGHRVERGRKTSRFHAICPECGGRLIRE
jgi:predicted Fe-Mo cluster-binding NifX family protein